VLSVPRGDLRRSADRVPSRWALDLASELAGGRWWADDLFTSRVHWVEHVASFDAGLRINRFPATEQEYRLGGLLDGARPAAPDAVLAAAQVAWQARRSNRFTRFDGHVAGVGMSSPAESTTSATRLEQWATCPFAYLMHYVLGVEIIEEPEARLRMSPTDRGNVVHQVMDTFLASVLARPAGDRPDPTTPWSTQDRAALLSIAESGCDQYQRRGLTGREIFWRRDRTEILRDLGRLLEEDDKHRRRTATRLEAAELAFGTRDAAIGTVGLGLADGRTLSFIGRADRVDVAEDGTLHVIDYKTGKADHYTELSQQNPVLRGKKLQLPVYGQAARLHRGQPDAAVRAEYWFVSARGKFERIGYVITDDVLHEVAQTLGTIVDGIERGIFPHHPAANSTNPRRECPYCDPDGLGVAELHRAWERKTGHDPTLARYLALTQDAPADGKGTPDEP
jgi:hypothetical protein